MILLAIGIVGAYYIIFWSSGGKGVGEDEMSNYWDARAEALRISLLIIEPQLWSPILSASS